MSRLSRRAMLALAPFTVLPARAATLEAEAGALLSALRTGPAAALCREAHAAILFPRLRDGFTVAGQHAQGAGLLSRGGVIGRFALAAPPHALPPGALVVLFMTEGALRPLLRAGAWGFGDAAAGPVVALLVDAAGPRPAPDLAEARLFRLEGSTREAPLPV